MLYGSVRGHRQGDRVAKFLVDRIAARGDRPTFVDPAEYPLPLLDKMAKEYASVDAMPDAMGRLHGLFEQADAYVVCTAEYNHAPPPALLNMLSTFQTEFYWKPSAIACYSVGSFGGVRAAMTLRCTLPELGMSSIPSILPFPNMNDLLDVAGKPAGDADRLHKRTDKFLDELNWYSDALAAKREEGIPG